MSPRDGRFWARTRIVGDCLEWQGGRYSTGYGSVWRRGVSYSTHRYAWMQMFGPIPDGLYVCHKCDNPPCVRPDHLFLGTALDNNRDAAQKGRTSAPRGERHPHAKLNLKEVDEIRQLLSAGELRHVDIGRKYGVARSTISEIHTGRKWGSAGSTL